ncbi:hairy [Carabus blaptoides fortunei]
MVTGTSSVAQPAPVTAANMTSERSVDTAVTPARRASDNRRSNKPIMEKRRRARINNCLNELKALILDAMKKDPARHSKLEKADILEMTVKHLENLQRQQVAMSAATDPAVLNKFRAGFSECAGEVGRFPGLEPAVKRRLLQHLANCLTGAKQEQIQPTNTNTAATTTQAVQVHILPSTAATTTGSLEPLSAHNGGIIFSNGNGTGVQLVPTRLPNGDIALVLPTTVAQQATFFRQTSPQAVISSPAPSPVPMLVPIPTRTASTASASSSASSASSSTSVLSAACYDQGAVLTRDPYSAPSSPEPMDIHPYSPPAQKPLSLVIRKSYEPVEEEKPWRPW